MSRRCIVMFSLAVLILAFAVSHYFPNTWQHFPNTLIEFWRVENKGIQSKIEAVLNNPQELGILLGVCIVCYMVLATCCKLTVYACIISVVFILIVAAAMVAIAKGVIQI